VELNESWSDAFTWISLMNFCIALVTYGLATDDHARTIHIAALKSQIELRAKTGEWIAFPLSRSTFHLNNFGNLFIVPSIMTLSNYLGVLECASS
jgi:hypothetical protein